MDERNPRSTYNQGYHQGRLRQWLDSLSWRRKLAVVIWALCVVGSFLPTSSSVILSGSGARFYLVSTAQRLIWISIPLLLIWVGSWLSGDDDMDTSMPSVVKTVLGIVLELIGWVNFARLIGLFVIGPLILLFS